MFLCLLNSTQVFSPYIPLLQIGAQYFSYLRHNSAAHAVKRRDRKDWYVTNWRRHVKLFLWYATFITKVSCFSFDRIICFLHFEYKFIDPPLPTPQPWMLRKCNDMNNSRARYYFNILFPKEYWNFLDLGLLTNMIMKSAVFYNVMSRICWCFGRSYCLHPQG
jgi:hypothetical protein